MSRTPGQAGFEPRTRDPERRAFFDLMRRVAAIEAGGGGGGSGAEEVFIGPSDPGTPYELWYDTDATPVRAYTTKSAGGSLAAGAGTTAILSLTTPVIPTGQLVLVTCSIRVSQTTAGAFDLSFTGTGTTTAAEGFGAGVSSTGVVRSFSWTATGTGATMTFNININPWGSQAVAYSNNTNIAAVLV